MKSVSPAKPILIVAACLGVIWAAFAGIRGVIKDEAEKTRAAMQESTKTIVLDNIRSTLDAVIDKGGGLPASAAETMKDVLLDRGGSRGDSNSDQAKEEVADERPKESLLSELFKSGQQVVRGVDDLIQDSLEMSPAERQEIGNRLHESIMESSEPIADSRLDKLLQQLSGPFLEDRIRPDVPIQFTVLNSEEVNAFAHVGGFVYVNRGLLDFVADDSELAFVLGHEIGHVELAHCGRQATVVARADQLSDGRLASAAAIAYRIASLGYAEDMEFEADAFAYRRMPGDRRSALRFLDRLSQLELELRPDQPEGSGVLAEIGDQLQQHFATHPKTRLRIESLLDIDLDKK